MNTNINFNSNSGNISPTTNLKQDPEIDDYGFTNVDLFKKENPVFTENEKYNGAIIGHEKTVQLENVMKYLNSGFNGENQEDAIQLATEMLDEASRIAHDTGVNNLAKITSPNPNFSDGIFRCLVSLCTQQNSTSKFLNYFLSTNTTSENSIRDQIKSKANNIISKSEAKNAITVSFNEKLEKASQEDKVDIIKTARELLSKAHTIATRFSSSNLSSDLKTIPKISNKHFSQEDFTNLVRICVHTNNS